MKNKTLEFLKEFILPEGITTVEDFSKLSYLEELEVRYYSVRLFYRNGWTLSGYSDPDSYANILNSLDSFGSKKDIVKSLVNSLDELPGMKKTVTNYIEECHHQYKGLELLFENGYFEKKIKN